MIDYKSAGWLLMAGWGIVLAGCADLQPGTRTSGLSPTAPSSLIGAAFAAPAYVPFKGTFEGHDYVDENLPPGATTFLIETTATGVGTLLGRFSLNREVTAKLADFSDTGSAQWIAANGDSISTTLAGQAVFDPSGAYVIVRETHTITGGTGRFAGAEGSFAVELYHKVEASGAVGTVEAHDISGSYEGTITAPGAV